MSLEEGEARWLRLPADTALELSRVWHEAALSDEQAQALVEDEAGCLGFTWHVDRPDYRYVVRRGSLQLPRSPGWTSWVLALQLPAGDDEVDVFSDDFAGRPEALGALEPGHGWARPGRGEGLADGVASLDVVRSMNPGDLRHTGAESRGLLSAMGVLAERPSEALRLLEPQRLARDGRYVATLMRPGGDATEEVEIDDRLPLGSGGGPAFAGLTADVEIWPLLLEKAAAKLLGGYDRLSGCSPLACLGMLAGSSELLAFRHGTPGTWTCASPGEAGQEALVPATWPDGGEEGEERPWPQLLEQLVDYLEGNCALLCGDHEGSIEGACHSLLAVRRDAAGPGRHLLQLRSLWGQEWLGAWGPGSELWQQRPDVKAGLAYEPSEGYFWMEAPDFFRRYCSIFVCVKDLGSRRPAAPRLVATPRTEAPPREAAPQGRALPQAAAASVTGLLQRLRELREAVEANNALWAQVSAAAADLRKDCAATLAIAGRPAA